MNLIRGYGFAHEFANGLQIKLLIDENGKIRDRLIEELFKYEFNNNHFSGTYRMYWPHETLIKRGEYQKLVKEKDNYKTLDAVLQTGIPEIVFNTIIFSHYNQQDIELLDQKTEEFCNWMNKHNRSTKWSLAFFHELPLPGSKKYTELIQRSFDINKHPELWAVSFNPTNGKFFTYDQLYDLKLKLMRKYDSVTLDSWITKGEYLCH
jgi:hypothetical protein